MISSRLASRRVKKRLWSGEWMFFTFVIATWCFAPFVRRLIDYHNGFYNPVQIASTLPFIVTVPLAYVAFRPKRLRRMRPTFRILAIVWFCSFAYGALIAFVNGNIAGAAYSFVQFVVPLIAGAWLAGQELETRIIAKRLTLILLSMAVLVAGYGIAQWVQPAPWDQLWIIGSKLVSMGAPVPFNLRIFATLNSTGPAADFFALILLLSLPYFRLKTIWIWPFAALLGSALLLTLVRESWVALVVGVIVYIAASPRRFRVVPFLVIFAVTLSFLVVALPTFLGAGKNSDVVANRLSTFNDVDHDSSARARQGEIADSLETALSNPIGIGLGTVGTSSALSTGGGGVNNVIDDGYLSRFDELGWFGFFGYLTVVFGGLASMIMVLRKPVSDRPFLVEDRVIVATALAMAASLVWSDVAGDAHLGLDGLLFWLAMGLGLHRSEPAARILTKVFAPKRSIDSSVRRTSPETAAVR